MFYIVVIELESLEERSCKIMGLPATQVDKLLVKLNGNNIPCYNLKDSIEAEAPGVRLLNFLSEQEFNYSVVSQSMAIENTVIGGRTVKVQKLVWTMIKKNIIKISKVNP